MGRKNIFNGLWAAPNPAESLTVPWIYGSERKRDCQNGRLKEEERRRTKSYICKVMSCVRFSSQQIVWLFKKSSCSWKVCYSICRLCQSKANKTM